MFKGSKSANNKNITYPNNFFPYLSSQIDKRKD